ncbi:hypothetical protein [Wenxinia marina]|uniref:Uncharacterized protein n=1 Tax=Wenxinia marina DSM 24838 TaxID=1123501 RepID=A0A0D0NME4_9RHOB|nr:hypothetical protein [Wenxinia marina]KIQ69480.1 hypothetical protein Wenmar_01842 [Wenxinia marina DSM 24838]GGL58683.1 hypothetical protein GCM10011392_11460 [Wenxinia marina]
MLDPLSIAFRGFLIDPKARKERYVHSFQYDKATSVTLAVIAMVIAIEAINLALRRRFA